MLDRTAISSAIARKHIVLDPYDPESLGSNSYDVHLSPFLLTYNRDAGGSVPNPDYTPGAPDYVPAPLDCARDNPTLLHVIPPEGFTLQPGRLYLGSTMEYTESHGLVPWLDGKSSGGRLGCFIHVTAGRGDVGFCGNWTLEILVPEPLTIYAAMPVGQLTFFRTHADLASALGNGGDPMVDYGKRVGSKYQRQGVIPVASRMHRNFPLPPVWLERAQALRDAYARGELT